MLRIISDSVNSVFPRFLNNIFRAYEIASHADVLRLVTRDKPWGLFTWREGAPANRATRLTELLGEG